MSKAETFRNLLQQLRVLHIEFAQESIPLLDNLDEEPTPDLVDCGFMFKQIEALCDEIRKDAKARQKAINKHLCQDLLEAYMTRGGTGDLKEKGEYATATAKPEFLVTPVPKREDPESYKKFMSACGVNPEIIEADLLRVHVPSLSKWKASLNKQGKELPDAIDKAVKKYSQPSITYRKRG